MAPNPYGDGDTYYGDVGMAREGALRVAPLGRAACLGARGEAQRLEAGGSR